MDVDLSAPLLLDGAVATNLFHTDFAPKGICQEQWILEHPQKLLQLQAAFCAAGSRVLYTPTFGASSARLAAYGLDDKVEEYNRRLAALTRQAASEGVLVAGAMSATGLELEPYGDTSFTEMMEVYRQQAQALDEAGVDLFVVESLTSISEARAAALALRKFHKPLMITLTVDEDGETPFGGTALNALVILQELGISAFGLNCSYGTQNIAEIVEQMAPYARIPLIAKPCAYQYDEDRELLVSLSPEEMARQMEQVLKAGASLVGGCCGTTPEHIAQIKLMLDRQPFTPPEPRYGDELGDIILADTRQLYNLYCENIEFSEPLTCSVDMTDELLQLEEENYDVILVNVDSVDDARDFAQNAHMANLPICFSSHNDSALRLALLLYNGRAMVDSHSSIEPEELGKIAKKYGAVIY